MARTETPLDPSAGPLQEFAFELRKLRTEAGNPTYRVLAKTAGYSATTLSEAAAGRRRPSLDVVLAYAGACGGDPAYWTRRWHELGPVAAVPGDALPGGAPPAAGRRLPPRGPLVAAAAVLVLAGSVAALWPSGGGHPSAGARPTAAGCPGRPAKVAFTGTTYGTGGATVLTASGPGVDIAGFAIGAPDDPGRPQTLRWHQLGLTARLTASWPAGHTTGRPVLLAAVVCLGGDGPTATATILSMPPGHPDRATAAALPPADLATARRSACQYPTAS